MGKISWFHYVTFTTCCSVAQSCLSLRPHGLWHSRLPCPSPSPRVCSNSCPWSQWCHPTISTCHPLLLLPSVIPSIRVFSTIKRIKKKKKRTSTEAPGRQKPMLLLTAVILKGSSQKILAGQQKEEENKREGKGRGARER